MYWLCIYKSLLATRHITNLNRGLATLSSTKSFSQANIMEFAALSGDHNPIHTGTNPNFGKPIVHGTLLLGHLSGMIASNYEGAVLQELNATFLKPLNVNEAITITAEPCALDRTALEMAIEGIVDSNKRVLTGTVKVVLTKQQIRQLRKTDAVKGLSNNQSSSQND